MPDSNSIKLIVQNERLLFVYGGVTYGFSYSFSEISGTVRVWSLGDNERFKLSGSYTDYINEDEEGFGLADLIAILAKHKGVGSPTGSTLKSYEIMLNQAVLDTLEDPMIIQAADLGVELGHGIKIHQNLTEVFVQPDGVPFNFGAQLELSNFNGEFSYWKFSTFDGHTEPRQFYSSFPIATANIPLFYSDAMLSIYSDAHITGGGPNAFILVKIYYDIVPLL